MREGDVYHWYYKNDLEYRKEKNLSGTAYWCMDNQCVFTGGSLFDTYWCYNLETFDSSCNKVNPDDIDLEFICNLSDVDMIEKWDVEDYDKVYNLSYQKGCYEKYAVDKGVGKSKVAIRNRMLKEIEEHKSSIEYSKRSIEHLEKQLEEL